MSASLSAILKDSDYRLSQFEGSPYIAELEGKITVRTDKNGKELYYAQCLVRGKEIRLTPEECVRQLYLAKLSQEYGYPAERMELEYPVKFGREVKRADIVIFDKDRPAAPTFWIPPSLRNPTACSVKNLRTVRLKCARQESRTTRKCTCFTFHPKNL